MEGERTGRVSGEDGDEDSVKGEAGTEGRSREERTGSSLGLSEASRPRVGSPGALCLLALLPERSEGRASRRG